jgi:hypothetical protein
MRGGDQFSRARFFWLPWMAAVALLLTDSAAPPQGLPTQVQEPAPDAMALCTAWRLSAKTSALAREIRSVAVERVERARKLAEQCKAAPECTREERVNLEQEAREAGYQETRAKDLAATMEARSSTLRKQFEDLRGKGAVEDCDKN